ncbi:iron chaperone [Nonomuraea sp. NPDC050663]|uniref:iron chaperone n=1 Tax=Nonomuraea sp. NPDC050663 TaxID=3364370 RepID=UPI0037A3D8B8
MTKDAGKSFEGFSEAERDAMKEHAKELKSAAGRRTSGTAKRDAEQEVLEKIAEMPEPDRGLAERIHAIVKTAAPHLAPRLWYGQPAYAKDGKVVCFFQGASKFKTKYATFGFQDAAHFDDVGLWATAFALTELSPEHEAMLAELVKKAAG